MIAVDSIQDDRQMLALTGLTQAAFCALSAPFAEGCRQQAEARFTPARPRRRKPGAGRKGVLKSGEQKLLFILFYLKTYPTFDVLGASFGLSRSKACEQAHRLAQALHRALTALGAVPARAFASPEQLRQALAGVPTLLLDATERPHQRAQAAVDRPADYSGKKKIYP